MINGAMRTTLVAMTAMMYAGCDSKKHPPSPSSAPAPTSDASASPAHPLTDVTHESGIDFIHDKHETGEFRFPELNGAGVGVLDYDNDGWYDLYFAQGGALPGVPGGKLLSDQLYRNRGEGTFENVTRRAGIDATGYGMAVVCGDYDNDGDTDIFVGNVGPNQFLRNNGDGTFTDVTKDLKLGDPRWALGGAFFDYDGDGWLDLFVSNYAIWDPSNEKHCTIRDSAQRDYCGPSVHQGDRDILYRNDGQGGFVDVSEQTGIAKLTGTGMGVVCADFTGDGLPDIYVANDAEPNRLWVQQADHTFVDEAGARFCDLNAEGKAESSMGIVAEDFDGNGRFDVLQTHFYRESNTLYMNQGDVFRDHTRITNLRSTTMPFTSFGISVIDLRNDGGMQLFIANGKVNMASKVEYQKDAPYAERNQVLEWSYDRRRFDDVTDAMGPAMESTAVSRGTATLDYDNDGDLDIVVANNNGPAQLLRNNAPASNHWLTVRCIGPDGKRDALGAVVEIETGSTIRRRLVYASSSYASSSAPLPHFGLGNRATVDRLTVHWPDGRRSTWRNLPTNRTWTAHHNDPTAETVN